METFNLTFESLMRALDEKQGLHWPHIKSLDFLKNAALFGENGIITEDRQLDIFPKEMFRRTLSFFNDIKNGVKIVGENEFLSTLDGFDIHQKRLVENDIILIMKFEFDNFEKLLKAFGKAFGKSQEELRKDPGSQEFFDKINSQDIKAAFAEVDEDSRHYSVFLINKGNCSLNVIMHEIIHYLQAVFGAGVIENQKKLKWKFQNDVYGLIQPGKLDVVFSRKELVPYIHSICYILEDHGIKTVKEALGILQKFLKYNGSPEEYISYCKRLPEYSWFTDEETPIHMLMLGVIYGRNMALFKTVMAKYFSQFEKII